MQGVDHVPLVEVTRGEIVESVHYGAFCVADRFGNLYAHAGNPEYLTFPRSSLKPFQALTLIEQGGAEHFGFFGEEIAIICGSHAGTPLHQAVLEGMHLKIGTTGEDLACGVHWPYDTEAREAMKLAGQSPTVFNHNCSGKHTGMLAYAKLRGFSTEDYLDPLHPVQVSIRETIADMVDLPPGALPLGIDGCSAPVYAISMDRMAQAVAKLADPTGLAVPRQGACRLITAAMMAHPVMVAGVGQFDTDLMIAAGGKVFSKGGAEGYQIIGVLPDAIAKGSPGLGIAIKIADGDPRGRARAAVSLTILKALGVLDEQDQARMVAYGNVPVQNWRKLVVGEVRPAFNWQDFAD
ncbi:MAG: asparaginase [Brevefilum sp.]|nr:asparaginase [Brevefilum sp.]